MRRYPIGAGDDAAVTRHRFALDHGSFPDPASRFQRELPEIARLAVTMIERMPIADYPGQFGWAYDAVNLFAPTRLHGTPDGARAFISRAHELGSAVIFDVVYKHVGPDGNFLREFPSDYFSSRYANKWGEPLNFDGANSAPVREFLVSNACDWIEEFHLDGLRLDATQQIFDASPTHILAEIARAVARLRSKRYSNARRREPQGKRTELGFVSPTPTQPRRPQPNNFPDPLFQCS